MYCSSYLDDFWDGREVTVQLLFRRVLLPGFVQFPSRFCLCVLSPSMWSIRSVVLTRALLGRNWRFISSDRSDFHMINSLSTSVNAFARRILTSLSEDEILLPRYVSLSTRFRGRPLRVKVVRSWLRHMYSVLFTFKWKPIHSAACFRQYSRDSA